MRKDYSRRDFLKVAGFSGLMAAVGGLEGKAPAEKGRRLVRFPGKADLILLTSRPPQLETPIQYFKELITPTEAVFVRWHISDVPTLIDSNEWRLKIGGHVEKEVEISLNELKMGFEKRRFAAVMQCSGNGRSFFEPGVPGGQWHHGSMGNVMWTGVLLKEVLKKAGMREGAVEVAFDGLDSSPLPSVPDYIKSLPIDKALGEDVLIAYEMNEEPLPLLHGFPARLIVPGWYATHWVKAIREITVLLKEYEGFWMKGAYRIPDNPCACIPPGSQPSKTIPNTRMNTKSLIIQPFEKASLVVNEGVEIIGVAFSGGYPIHEVVVSTDEGKTWKQARLGKDLGKYSWIQWFHSWKPSEPGRYAIMAKATNSIGESQPFESLWNPSGYMWNRVERREVLVEKGKR